MNKIAPLALCLALTGVAGCATDKPVAAGGSAATSTEEPVTGSRLPPPRSRTTEQK